MCSFYTFPALISASYPVDEYHTNNSENYLQLVSVSFAYSGIQELNLVYGLVELPRVELGKFACKANVSPVTQPRRCQPISGLALFARLRYYTLNVVSSTRKLLVRRFLSVCGAVASRTPFY